MDDINLLILSGCNEISRPPEIMLNDIYYRHLQKMFDLKGRKCRVYFLDNRSQNLKDKLFEKINHHKITHVIYRCLTIDMMTKTKFWGLNSKCPGIVKLFDYIVGICSGRLNKVLKEEINKISQINIYIDIVLIIIPPINGGLPRLVRWLINFYSKNIYNEFGYLFMAPRNKYGFEIIDMIDGYHFSKEGHLTLANLLFWELTPYYGMKGLTDLYIQHEKKQMKTSFSFIWFIVFALVTFFFGVFSEVIWEMLNGKG